MLFIENQPMSHLKYALLGLFCLIHLESRTQEIKVSYDYSAAEKLLKIFEAEQLSEEDFQELVALQGTQAYLKKLATFFPNIGTETYKKSLKAALKGSYMDSDPYMFKRLKPLLPASRELLAQVKRRQLQLTESSLSQLKEYTPEETSADITAFLTLGVIGGGWTFDDDPESFYVDLSSMKGDYLGLAYLCMHELYHLIQYRFMKPADKNDRVDFILDQMIREGSATYIADFSKIEASGEYVDFSKKEYDRNFKRIDADFALFESILFQAKYDEDVEPEKLYTIGYSGMFQSPLYYVGYHLMKLITKYKGKQELISLLKRPSHELLLNYMELVDKYSGVDKEFIPFSKAIRTIIESQDE